MSPSLRRAVLAAALLTVGRPLGAQAPAVDELLQAARASHTDALVVLKDGRTVVDWSAGEPGTIELMSAFKSVVAIAVGRLLHEGAIDSLDQPVHTLYPEWAQGRKRAITIRHLLNHTSGLQNVPNAGAEIYPAPDAIQLALAAELTDDPGGRFAYNNKAVNLLAGVIARASGLRLDLYIQDRLFGPLEITAYQWYFDRSGSPHAMAGLRLHARDAAKLGQLVLDRGVWKGARLVAESFLEAMLAPGQPHYPLAGLLWWRWPESQSVRLRTGPALERLPADARRAVGGLVGRTFASRRDARAGVLAALGGESDSVLVRAIGPDWMDRLFEWTIGPVKAYYADGYLGQYIVVVPDERVVAVRQIRSRPDYNPGTDGFPDFPAMVLRLAPRLTAP